MNVLQQFRLDDRVAVVTGAGSGLGARFAGVLADAGADVVLAARRIERLDETAAHRESLGRRAIVVPADVSDPGDCERVAQTAIRQLGRIDILVNNAGIGTARPALRESPAEFRAVIDVNLEGAYWMAQECARAMDRGSSIVNIASTLGFIASYAPQAAYSASKAGLIGLTRDLSQQGAGRRGIRVNAIAPGYFATEMTEQVPPQDLHRFVESRSPLARLGERHELDGALLFLTSDASTYVTGSTISVDGGMAGR